jgi:hypothetical protein
LRDKDHAKLLKRLTRLFHLAHQNLCHIICMVLQRMGADQCESNMWAIQLRTVISTKLQGGVLELEEPLRCDEFTRNNHKMFKYIKQLQVLQERRTGGQSILFTNVAYIFQEIEKTHINRVKDIMIAALNQEAILLQRVPTQDPVDLACGEQILMPPQMAQ